MSKYVLTIDAGTTSERAILFNKKGEILNISQKELEQFYPNPGWVEHDPDEIWKTQKFTIDNVMQKEGVNISELAVIGITNQWETTVIWDRETGKALHKAIVWQDRRTSEYCDKLKSDGHIEMIQDKTGLLIDSYFSATKIRWILDHIEGAQKSAENGKLAFGTIDSWLLWKLTKGKVHATDVTNASRTMLFNIHELDWDDDLLNLFNIPKSMLPEVKQSSDYYYDKKLAYQYIKRVQTDVCVMIGDASEESNHPIIVVNDTREAVKGMLKIKNADDGKLLYSKSFNVDQNGKSIEGYLPESIKPELWLIEWELNDNTYTNHYFSFKPQVDLEVYLKWLPML